MSDAKIETMVMITGREYEALRAENAAHNHAEVKYLVEIDALRAENEQLKTSGIAEVAAHNPSVMDWINHWEGRTLKAEAENEKLRSALKSCIAMLEQLGYTPISKVARAALEEKQ